MIPTCFPKRVVIILSLLVTVNAAISLLFVSWLPVGFFAGKTFGVVLSDLSFVEGAFVFLVGAAVAFYDVKVTAKTKVLMATGAILVGLSIAFGFSL